MKISCIIAHRETEPPLLDRARAEALGWGDVQIIHVRGNLPSMQRNIAANKADGEILYFLDSDALPERGNLDRLRKVFSTMPDVAVCGGPSLTPAGDSARQHAFGHALGSFWGTAWMSSRYRSRGSARYSSDRELILCNLAFRREVFLDHNGFDESLYPNEENDLMDRIADTGLRLYHDPNLTVDRSQRHGFREFLRQLFGYGRGRSEQLRADFRIVNLPIFIFICFPVYIFILPFLAFVSPLFLVPAGLHLILDFVVSLPLLFKKAAAFIPAVPSFFFCHLLYGLGMWRGLFGRFRNSRVKDPEAEVRIV